MNTVTRPATAREVRADYRENGHDVRISREGRVTFRRGGCGPWLEGRYVSEYRCILDLATNRVSIVLT